MPKTAKLNMAEKMSEELPPLLPADNPIQDYLSY